MPRLILFPVPIGSDDIAKTLPSANAELLGECRHFIVEQVRTARRNLKRMGYPHSIDETTFFELNQHTPETEIGTFLDPIAQGNSVGLMSEAGLPCIADPGARIVELAHRRNIEVLPLVGPSSLLLGLMASGFNGQRFAFLGYLPFDERQRQTTLNTMDRNIYQHDQTQILIETPYRNNKLLAELAGSMRESTRICVACDLTLPTQYVRTLPARQWLQKPPDLNKRYCVFLVYK